MKKNNNIIDLDIDIIGGMGVITQEESIGLSNFIKLDKEKILKKEMRKAKLKINKRKTETV